MHLSVVGTPDPAGAATCEQALAALGGDNPALRARVLAGLAYYRALSESQGIAASALAEEALDLAHEAGDPDALALALFVRAICLTGSVHVEERIRLADELLELSVTTDNMFHRSQGLRVRAPARLELTDIAGFDADVAAIEDVGTELRSWYCMALAAEWKTLRAMMQGRFADAERHAAEVMEHGGREQNFVNVWTTQMFFLYGELGRFADIYPVAKPAIDANPGIVAFTAGLALMELEIGMVDEALARYEAIAADGFAIVPRDATWTACLTVLSEICAGRSDAPRAQALYDLLLPRRGSLAVWVWGVACAGSIDRYLGMLAATMGDAKKAAEHYEAALVQEKSVGAAPLVARTSYWFGRSLVGSADEAERERGRLLLEESRRSADELGMAALANAAKTT
jgi:tetratricopeptide (TPR) repeat protein